MSRHTGINMSNLALPMVRKQFEELRNFRVSAASQASQLLKIYSTIKTGGWIEPWDKFSLLPSGWVHIFVKLVRASLLLCCLRLLRNCAPALSIIQNVSVGRTLPELFHHSQWSLSMTKIAHWGTPAASTAPASTSLRCGSGRWCSRPPLLQFRLGWSSFQQSNLDLPHGKGGERVGGTGKKE